MPHDDGLDRLQKINHIVVLMMENRSFDQMLGYLALDGLDVEGLNKAEPNEDVEGNSYPVHEYGPDETVFHPAQDPTGKVLDPCHSPDCVKAQLADGNKGFVKSFLATRKDKQGNAVEIPDEYRNLVMGYYTDRHLPVYDHLARNYCVCDHWHASIPGDTWPNRLYSLAATTSESVGHKLGVFERFKELSIAKLLRNIPVFEVEAFTRHLDDAQWRWYSHDPATLRAADARYRDLLHLHRDNFTYFNRRRVSFATEAAESLIDARDSFLDDAAKNELRDVSWIDPNFIDLSVLDPNSNDDHPPSDVLAGQAFVLELYEALANSPAWEDTVLVITYDEHGGFYDHVPPPKVDDGSEYETYGVRVPALIVGPRVKQHVCHELFDHTSLIKTILLRFASDGEKAIDEMSARVGHQRLKKANHLGMVLEDEPRTDTVDRGDLHDRLANWRQKARADRRATDQKPSPLAGDGAGQEQTRTDFQEEFVGFALAMRRAGLPSNQP